jgi:phosphoglycolate phosphatase-like HAD superfamily hydrolase
MSSHPLSGLFAPIVSSFVRVIEGLTDLAAVIPLYLVRNCNDWYMEAFLDHSGTRHLFADAVCHGTTGLPKHENLRNLMARDGLQRGYYVGDTNGDRTAAEMAGLVYVGQPNMGLAGKVCRQTSGAGTLRPS